MTSTYNTITNMIILTSTYNTITSMIRVTSIIIILEMLVFNQAIEIKMEKGL